MLVPVALVRGVTVTVVEIVGVVAVLDRLVPAAGTVLVGMRLVNHVRLQPALVVVPVVLAVRVAVVQVVRMVPVLDSHVAAIGSVLMGMAFVHVVGNVRHHFFSCAWSRAARAIRSTWSSAIEYEFSLPTRRALISVDVRNTARC